MTGLGIYPDGMWPRRISGSAAMRGADPALFGAFIMSGWMVGRGVVSEALEAESSYSSKHLVQHTVKMSMQYGGKKIKLFILTTDSGMDDPVVFI